jgi:hypothetical protein
MREINPIAFEDMLHLELEQIGVREDIAAATEYAVFPVILNGGVQQFIQLPGFVDNCGHVYSPTRAPAMEYAHRCRKNLAEK